MKYIVELEQGVWIAKWDGDPGRTVVKDYAKVFTDKKKAKIALEKCREYRLFTDAIIKEIKQK